MPLSQKVTITGGIPNPLPITDNGGSVTVDGVVAVSGPVATAGDMSGTVAIPLAAYNATQTTATIINTGYQGILIRFNVTAVPGTQTVQLQVLADIGGNLEVYTAAFATVVAITKSIYIIHPGMTVVDLSLTASKNIPVPGRYAIRVTHSGAGNFTYSVIITPVP